MAKRDRPRHSGASKRSGRGQGGRPAKRPKLQSNLPTKGKYYDLLEIYDTINWQYFEGKIQARISWGRKLPTPQRHHQHIKMGSCSVANRLITIHHALDRSWVPCFFVKSIVFHEMLHIKYPPRWKNGRHDWHYAEFKVAEKKFADYAKAEQWEKVNLNRLCFF